MNEGFYKYILEQLLYAPNFVSGPGFHLEKNLKNENQYPVDGWYWFDSLSDACNFFNLDIQNYLPKQDEI